MKKVLIAYDSRPGRPGRWRRIIAEGSVLPATKRRYERSPNPRMKRNFQGYDGYFRFPDVLPDMIGFHEMFLFCLRLPILRARSAAPLVPTTISAMPQLIFDTMENVFKMDMVNLGVVQSPGAEVGTTEGCGLPGVRKGLRRTTGRS